MDNLFYEKYLKYKAKYLALGGGDIDISKSANQQLFEKIQQFYQLMNAMFIGNKEAKQDLKKIIIFDRKNENFTLVDNFDHTNIMDVFKDKLKDFADNKNLYDYISELKSELETNSFNSSYFYIFIQTLYNSVPDDIKTKAAPPLTSIDDKQLLTDSINMLTQIREDQSIPPDSGLDSGSSSKPPPKPPNPDSGLDSGSSSKPPPKPPNPTPDPRNLNCTCEFMKPKDKDKDYK